MGFVQSPRSRDFIKKASDLRDDLCKARSSMGALWKFYVWSFLGAVWELPGSFQGAFRKITGIFTISQIKGFFKKTSVLRDDRCKEQNQLYINEILLEFSTISQIEGFRKKASVLRDDPCEERHLKAMHGNQAEIVRSHRSRHFIKKAEDLRDDPCNARSFLKTHIKPS